MSTQCVCCCRANERVSAEGMRRWRWVAYEYMTGPNRPPGATTSWGGPFGGGGGGGRRGTQCGSAADQRGALCQGEDAGGVSVLRGAASIGGASAEVGRGGVS